MPPLARINPSRRRGNKPEIGRLAWLAIGLAASQIALLGFFQMAPLLKRALRVRTESALVRSARLSYGEEFAEYVLFLREVVPEDALVVIPWREADPVLGEMPFMQYFLFPRLLTNCPAPPEWSACVANYGGSRTYLIAVDTFPPRAGLEGLKEYLPFDGSRGVLVPQKDGGD
jgi:hypothetical protein